MVGDILQPTHLLFVLVVALLVLGPKRLPEVARTLGNGIRDFRSAISGESHGDAEPERGYLAADTAPSPPATSHEPPATGHEPPARTDAPPAPTDTPPATSHEPPAPTDGPPIASPGPPQAAPATRPDSQPPSSDRPAPVTEPVNQTPPGA